MLVVTKASKFYVKGLDLYLDDTWYLHGITNIQTNQINSLLSKYETIHIYIIFKVPMLIQKPQCWIYSNAKFHTYG